MECAANTRVFMGWGGVQESNICVTAEHYALIKQAMIGGGGGGRSSPIQTPRHVRCLTHLREVAIVGKNLKISVLGSHLVV